MRPLRTSCWMVGNANLVVQGDGRTVAALETGARPTDHGRTREGAFQSAARENARNRPPVPAVPAGDSTRRRGGTHVPLARHAPAPALRHDPPGPGGGRLRSGPGAL